jgi:hypothetical protein
MTPGIRPRAFILKMSLRAIDLNTADDLSVFVDKTIQQTGLVLNSGPALSGLGRHIPVEYRDTGWVCPSRPPS